MSEAKSIVVRAIRDGVGVRDAMALVDRSEHTYKDWREQDPAFAAQVDEVREVARAARARGQDGKPEVPDFPEFCAEYLGMPLPEHHLRVWDVLNGREPRNMHPAIRWQRGRDNRLLLNFAPFHAKTQCWSVQYALWRMMKDPNVRIAIVSKTQALAKKIIHQIAQVLQLPQYAKLHAAFMPEGGWKGSDGWTKTEIYLAGVDVAQKDPTLQALGLGGQIYGSRLDVILLDDLVDMKNVHTYKELADWIGTEVDSRVDDNGILACLGTRLAPDDLYSELRDLVDYDGETPVWTYFAQPAVLDMPEPNPESWVTLWPFKADGSPMWDGVSLARKKAVLPSEARWQLTYQQMDASLEQVFPSGAVMAAVDHRRAAGPMDGLHTVLGVDPAADGYTAMIVAGLDRGSGQVFVLDGFNMPKCPPALLISTMKSLVVKHGVKEVVVERNAFQGFLSRNEDLRAFCFAHGCLLTEHYTGCVPEDVEILTAAGWKRHAELEVGELVASADGWTVVEGINLFDAPETMTRIRGDLIDCDFTAEHRHLVEWRGNSTRELRMVTTNELKSNTPIVVQAQPHVGDGIGEHLAALLGWYLAEGSLKSGGGVEIGQRREVNADKYTRIVAHLDALGWRHSDSWDRIYVFKADAEALTRLAPGPRKLLEPRVVAEMTIAERRAFIDALIDGDGCRSGGRRVLGNTNSRILDCFEMAVALNGETTHRALQDRETQFRANHAAFTSSIRSGRLSHAAHPQHPLTSEVPGQGRVWCPTTGSGTWIARSRGTVFVTGNSQKWDENLGVSSMAPRFLSCATHDVVADRWTPTPFDQHLISLPNPKFSTFVDQLITQLTTWQPRTGRQLTVTDLVMALWFAMIGIQKVIDQARNVPRHLDNQFITRADQRKRAVVNLQEIRDHQLRTTGDVLIDFATGRQLL